MARIVALDYGLKRVGVATTDPLKIIATSLITCATPEILNFLKNYLAEEEVESFLVGIPNSLDGGDSIMKKKVVEFIKIIEEKFPDIKVYTFDERFTTKLAHHTVIQSGISKKKRQQKSLYDKVSATILLQSYLESYQFRQNYSYPEK